MPEPDPLPISALQHWSYCPRQCGLIHLEQAFEENVHTLRGQAVHARVDAPGFEARAGVRVERSLPLASERLGLIGKADIVEFLPDGTPYPVEYKHGRVTKAQHGHDALQLAAQAICLEEMTGLAVPEGALFYASSKRRVRVTVDATLRAAVEEAVRAIRAMLATGVLPPPANDTRCRACSLIDLCQPQALAARDAQRRLRSALFDPDA
ncbi:MAG: CRISPR-associated protein Cas4 [Burkholderiaceae bacterium]|jgi:CRISPR-associated exonuclease Cas4|nr:CRISPR-associated protein Cas4 [Burkholderiaceae bacterium]